MLKELLAGTLLALTLQSSGEGKIEDLKKTEDVELTEISRLAINSTYKGVEILTEREALRLLIESLEEEDRKSEELKAAVKLEENRIKQQEDRRQYEINKYGRYVGEKLRFEATAYTPYCTGCSGVTKVGLDVRSNFQNVVAVDPNVIPLHSTIAVYHKGELYGVYYAGDTGGVIRGKIIDILHRTKVEAYAFGRQQVEIEILELPS